MKLTTKGRYAVMALLELAAYEGTAPLTLSVIAERQQLSLSYLELLFGKLRRCGLVSSVRGPGGGYVLAQQPDVVLTDIEMPRMDGFELLGAIRNDPHTRAVPVIMISSRTGQKHRSRAEALGVNAYLGKPYTESDLIARIDQFIGDRRPSGEEGSKAQENKE